MAEFKAFAFFLEKASRITDIEAQEMQCGTKNERDIASSSPTELVITDHLPNNHNHYKRD